MTVWYPSDSIILTRGRDPFGELLNMTGGFPLEWAGKTWKSSEALYQAARFPDDESIQEEIRGANNGFTAKLIAKAHHVETRSDWETGGVRLSAMIQVCTLKMEQHQRVRLALALTEHKPIVERSKRDQFWGTKPQEDGTLVGDNMLGKIWMNLRFGRLMEYDKTLPGNIISDFFC